MKKIFILLIFLSYGVFGEELRVRLNTDYHQKIGKVSITLLGDKVGVAEDRNRCMPDEFGRPFACTRMAIFYYESPIRLLKESKDKTMKLFEIEKKLKYRLMIQKNMARLVEIDAETGRTVASYALHPEYIY
jgi:hypothetical protein